MAAALQTRDWRPNQVICSMTAVLLACIIAAFVLAMFNSVPRSSIRATPIQIRLVTRSFPQQFNLIKKAIRQLEYRRQTAILKNQPQPLKTEIIPLKGMLPLSKPVNWWKQLHSAIGQTHIPPNSSGLILPKHAVISPLQQALNAPRRIAPLQNGASYRSIYGNVFLRSDGLCSELQTVQIGPSPSNKVTVASPGVCSDGYYPKMSQQLMEWANQEARKHPPG